MHIFKKQKQKQSIIKLNKQSINLTWYTMWIDFRNKNMFRSCIMKLKWTNSNVATSPIFDGLQSKTIWLWSSSVIRIVKMKYNRINIKWWLVSTSFKIYLDILSYLYITFTIFYYNTISLKCTLCSCSSWRTLSNRIIQFTCNAVNTHLIHRRIFLFSTPCGVGSLLCMRNINCKPHWLAICCLSSRIFYFFLDRQFRS